MCIFVDMKQTLPEYIAQHEELRQLLLAQEGGIMKYLAEHLDASDSATLFRDYQNLCVEKFHEANKWVLYKVWEGDDMRRAALGEMEHFRKELHYQEALKQLLAELPKKEAEKIDDFVEMYLTYAYKLDRLRWHPNGMTNIDVYQEIIGMYSSLGLAYKCMKLILKEYHSNGDIKKTESDMLIEFSIRQWSDQLTINAFFQMRQAVAEMLAGKDDDQCQRMAIDTMEKLRGFSQMIYTDAMVQALREINYTSEADQRESDGEWLRDVAKHAVLEEFSNHIRIKSMRYYFSNFVNLLTDIGRIWAAQLLIHDIDIQVLEKQVSCVLLPSDTPRFYVDKYYSDDLPGRYCISNINQAEKILEKLGHKPVPDSYLEVINKDAEAEVITKLSKAYNQLIEERLVSKETDLTTFIEVMLNNADKKIVWINDKGQKFLRTLIKVFLGTSNKYSYPPILKVNVNGSYAAFIKTHFVDDKKKTIDFKTNGHDTGKKDKEKIERILKAIYVYIGYPKPKKA